jgi:hypothetical protein
MLVLLDQLPVLLTLSLLVTTHASLVEGVLSPLANLGYAAHGLEGSLDEIAVVSHENVAALSEGESGVVGHSLVVRAAERLGPGDLVGVALHLEVLMAFRFAEAEGLGIVAHYIGQWKALSNGWWIFIPNVIT